ncbi:MAG: hypothetical protein JWN82_403 [Candidatus Saccharibacteria bacterium]|nr:hypothetical protein [Candidatus Saccharibacteria bacterium]
MKIITICSSANFYKEVMALKQQLEELGYAVLVPATAQKMQASGDFDVASYKTWFGDANDYHKKAALMRGHFDEVAKADAVLIVNNEKHGVANYIGGNVLMEMALAFYQNKPIYLLNDIPSESAFEEEIIGLGSVPLGGDIQKLATSFPA